MINLRVSFKASIDNDDHSFTTKSEAITVAQKLTNNQSGAYDYIDEGDYKYMVFSEYAYVTVEDDGTPLYNQIDDVNPQIDDADFSSVKRLK